ncbi:MAG: FGGY-family carbohydrate kinase [Firmicutes bacterium]|nr:FGGY-family carbohydrate kinase [Bacillota bacterium]
MRAADIIHTGRTSLGIELGSTRIKAVLIGEDHSVLANGSFSWENRLENNLWTYRLDDAVQGLQESFADLAADVRRRYGVELTTIGAIGISGMMHGYLALDKESRQLAPFLTWRNTNTSEAAGELTELFQFNVPLRWSISQLYQAILNGEIHVPQIDYITTLAGYIHYLLTGRRVMGIGEASGMFPIDSSIMDYDQTMLDQFDALVADREFSWKIRDILPTVLVAGQNAGHLTERGAKLLDSSGKLRPGIPMAPPEGDAGTGMVATNSVDACTGNVSAGTSIFSMVVLERKLSRLYRDIDMVTTPSGRPVAMVHCNNGTSELDAWTRMFGEILTVVGADVSRGELYGILFHESLNGSADCDDVTLYNYISAEPVTGLNDGRPLLVRRKDSKLTLANFMRSQIYSIFASLAVGHRILEAEQVQIKRLTGHGGLFKTPGVAQKYLAAAMNAPVTVMKTAGEGGPYGMALLASYLLHARESTLEDYLENVVFGGVEGSTMEPETADVTGYAAYLTAYCDALNLEHCAVKCVK